jgi:hypothetical protein
MQQSVLHSLFTMAREYKQSKVYMETIEGLRYNDEVGADVKPLL